LSAETNADTIRFSSLARVTATMVATSRKPASLANEMSAVGPNDGPLFQLPGDSGEPVPLMAYAPGTFPGNAVEMLLLNVSRPCAPQRVYETHPPEAVNTIVVAGNVLGWLPENSIAREMRVTSMTIARGEQWTTQLEIRVYRSSDTQSAAADEL
jgi:LysR family transcriptional regulator, hypochlorite-specific transcription factor HypT